MDPFAFFVQNIVIGVAVIAAIAIGLALTRD
jgi:hypothetical protein